MIDAHDVINLSSNNYLGLATHPQFKQAAIKAIELLGVGIRRGAHHHRHNGNT